MPFFHLFCAIDPCTEQTSPVTTTTTVQLILSIAIPVHAHPSFLSVPWFPRTCLSTIQSYLGSCHPSVSPLQQPHDEFSNPPHHDGTYSRILLASAKHKSANPAYPLLLSLFSVLLFHWLLTACKEEKKRKEKERVCIAPISHTSRKALSLFLDVG